MVNHFTKDRHAVLLILPSIENMTVPEVIEILRLRNNCLSRIASNHIQEVPVIPFDLERFIRMPELPPPTLLREELLADRGKIKRVNLLTKSSHNTSLVTGFWKSVFH